MFWSNNLGRVKISIWSEDKAENCLDIGPCLELAGSDSQKAITPVASSSAKVDLLFAAKSLHFREADYYVQALW
jgi:hypothetical protein